MAAAAAPLSEIAAQALRTLTRALNTHDAEALGRAPTALKTLSRVLRQLSEKKMKAFANQFEGTTRPVLYESVLPDGRVSGLTDNYIRVVTDSPQAVTGVIRPTRLGSFQNGQSEGWIPA